MLADTVVAYQRPQAFVVTGVFTNTIPGVAQVNELLRT